MLNKFDIIQKACLTEKSRAFQKFVNLYTFKVHPKATKPEIKKAVEQIYSVRVLNVRTMIMHGKVKRSGRAERKLANWKKALVTLDPNDSIAEFKGV